MICTSSVSSSQGVLFSKEPLVAGSCFQVRIERTDGRWTGSLMIGVTGQRPEKVNFIFLFGLSDTLN